MCIRDRLTAVAPWLLPVALVIGGAYLCFEGGEKILERFGGAAHVEVESGPVDEAQIIRQAITTDFVLSTEIYTRSIVGSVRCV